MSMMSMVAEAIDSISGPWDASAHEHAGIDYKQTPDSAGNLDRRAPEKFVKDLAESVVCFANGPTDGALVIGVRNRAVDRDDAIVGVDLRRWSLPDLVHQIHTRTSPSITVQAQAMDIEGRTLFVLVVPQGRTVHSTTEGVYKIRLGDRCMPLEGDQLRGLRASRHDYDWSAESSGMTSASLSPSALERAAQRLREQNNLELASLAQHDPTGFCGATELLASDGRVNRAGVLLYGNADALRAIPGWGVNVQTRETPGSDPRVLLRRHEVDIPLVVLLDHLIGIVATLARSSSIRVGATQVELVDYPGDAVREILANAFAHRDWEVPGVVEVVHSPDELVITSPGGLLPSLRVDRLLHDASAARNPVLARHMARLRLAEVSGLGFDRAFRELARMGKEPPHLEDGPRFRCVMPGGGGDEAFARFLHSSTFPNRLHGDVDVLMSLTALRHLKRLSAAELSGRLQRNATDVARVLERMREVGLVEPTKATSRQTFPRYTLTATAVAGMRASLTYRTDSIDSDDAKLIRHLRRHGRIANEDVRNYLDCDVTTARNRLRRLRDRGLIDIASDSPRRGPSVVYEKTDALALVED